MNTTRNRPTDVQQTFCRNFLKHCQSSMVREVLGKLILGSIVSQIFSKKKKKDMNLLNSQQSQQERH